MPRYQIDSTGNGAFFTITRLTDGATVFFQGDDAVQFGVYLSYTNDHYTDDDLCASYQHLMEVPAGSCEHCPAEGGGCIVCQPR